MNPIATALLIVVLTGFFVAYTIRRRWLLMNMGPWDLAFDRLADRLSLMFRFAIGQWRMPRHWIAGAAHIFIYLGAVVMLLRALILFARGFVDNPHFGFWLFDTGTTLGGIYSLVKDIFVVLVMLGVIIFFYYRVISRLPRMTLNFEGLLILMILTTLMLSDMLYDGANMALHGEKANMWEPLGSLLVGPLSGASVGTQTFLYHLGFWVHITTILLFMNILPYTKQFHEITAFPNVFFQPLKPPGQLQKMEDMEGMIEREETLGIKRIDQFGSKAVLDFFSCTECGRCQAACPANRTGKLLSPKELTVHLRDFAYEHETALISSNGKSNGNGNGNGDGATETEAEPLPHQIDLVDGPIKPEVLWACTSCRACEQECPVFITYVDRIVEMRRYLVQERGEFPDELQNAFRSLETNMNPYSSPPDERTAWAKNMDVPLMAENPDADVLYWVGCAAAYDDRAKKIARATASLLKAAGVNFAILGEEEQCTGDPARRAGNEFLFQMIAEANIEILNNYNPKTIVTACPHCYNTLKHEYPEFGGHYNVVHHSEFFADLIKQGKLKPHNTVDAKVVFHDSCYLGRYNEIYEAPRDMLRSIPGVRLVEPKEDTFDRGMCCGAGGAQMFKEEEEGTQKVNHLRADQLLETNPNTIATACPFCQRMLGDSLADKEREDIGQFDIAELLWQSVEQPES